jgi:hypothetical protein
VKLYVVPFKFKLFVAFAEVISTAITLTIAQPVELDRTLLGASVAAAGAFFRRG